MLVIARLCNGLGSARAATRRYTADYVSRRHRTAAAALFVACSTLGQGIGPLLSLPAGMLPHFTVGGVIEINQVGVGRRQEKGGSWCGKKKQ
jgi:hypothetical protein